MKWIPGTVTSSWLDQLRQRLALAAHQNGTRFGIDEQFWCVGFFQPIGVVLHDFDNIGGFSGRGISRGQLSVGRRSSPGSSKGRRYSSISFSESARWIECGKISSTKVLFFSTSSSPALDRNP